jgi:hypothetical protein
MEEYFTNVKSLFLPLGGCFITQNAGPLIVLFLPLCPSGIRGFNILVGRGEREWGERRGGKGAAFFCSSMGGGQEGPFFSDEYGGNGERTIFFFFLCC